MSRPLDKRTICLKSEKEAFSRERGDFGCEFQRRKVLCDDLSFRNGNRSFVGIP